MKKIGFFALLLLIPVGVLSQKVTVQIIKAEKAAISEWQVLDEKFNIALSGNEYYRNDSISFSLDAGKRYFLQISVSEIINRNTDIYTLILNNEPILLIGSDIGSGDHLFPFFTGVRDENVKITGGTNALISDFPWQVYYISGNFRCGGSIIANNWIVTAAHCTKNSSGNPIAVSDMSVKVGLNNPSVGGQTYFVSDVIVNEGFDSQTLLNDIALLKLTQPINNPSAAPIKLVTSDDVLNGATDPGVMAWVTGWGLTHVNPNVLPTSLQKVQLPIISIAQASTVWGTIPATDIMAGFLNGNKDACSGDSGGPMAVPVIDEYKLAGIVSWGSQNCNTYGAYTRISGQEAWIRQNTGIVKEYRPPAPAGDTLICKGVVSSQYSVGSLQGATAYEWRILPSDAGVVTANSSDATVLWNTGFTGSATLILRVTINNVVSEWSRLKLKVVLNTKLLRQTTDTVICARQPVDLSVGAEGYNLNYKWYKNGTLIQSGPSPKVILSNTTTDDSGAYKYEISGYCGTLITGVINLTVHPLTTISVISPDVEVPFGKDVTLNVTAGGYDLSYQWQKDSIILQNTNTPSLFLNSLNAQDIGLYRVSVSGFCGSVLSDIIYVYVKKANYTGEPDVFLWPSVTSTEFTVAVSNDSFYSVFIYNALGQVVRKQANCRFQTTVNVSTAAKGTYVVKVFNSDFQKTIKFIKN